MAPRVISLSLAAACAVAALILALASADARRLERAETAGARGDYQLSLSEAKKVRSEPSLTRAYAVRAYAAGRLGDLPNSSRWFKLAVRAAPHDWLLRQDWSTVLALLGEQPASKRQRRIAKQLNPRIGTPL